MLLCMRTFQRMPNRFLLLFCPHGGSRVEIVLGPFQNLWNRLIGHHYIKVILLDRRTSALSGDAGNHQ